MGTDELAPAEQSPGQQPLVLLPSLCFGAPFSLQPDGKQVFITPAGKLVCPANPCSNLDPDPNPNPNPRTLTRPQSDAAGPLYPSSCGTAANPNSEPNPEPKPNPKPKSLTLTLTLSLALTLTLTITRWDQDKLSLNDSLGYCEARLDDCLPGNPGPNPNPSSNPSPNPSPNPDPNAWTIACQVYPSSSA